MHPIVSEQIATIHMQERHREAAAARRAATVRRRHARLRVAAAAWALRLARALDRDGRVVPAPARGR